MEPSSGQSFPEASTFISTSNSESKPVKKNWFRKIFFVPILVLIIVIVGFLILQMFPKKLPSQTQSVVTFSTKDEQLVQQANVLEGKGIPGAKILVTITPNGTKADITVDKEGRWKYDVPENVKPGNYNLTVVIKDKANNISSVKNYPIEITSNHEANFLNKVGKKQTLNLSLVKDVYAQSAIPSGSRCDPTDTVNLCSTGNVCQMATASVGSIVAGNYYCFGTGGGGAVNLCTKQPDKGEKYYPSDSATCNNPNGCYRVQYDCAAGNRCFNYYVQSSSTISCSIVDYPVREGGYTFACWPDSSCNYAGTGWTGTECDASGHCTDNATSCGSRYLPGVTPNQYDPSTYNPANMYCQQIQYDLPGQYCYQYSYRDSSTQCQWRQQDFYLQSGQNWKCYFEKDTRCKPLPVKTLEKLGSEYDAWVARMKRLSIYPARELRDGVPGGIVYVSREEYQQEVCNGNPACISPHYDEFIDGIQNNNYTYLVALGNKLREQCYVPFEVMEPFFSDASDLFNGAKRDGSNIIEYPSLSYMYDDPPGCSGRVKHGFTGTPEEQQIQLSQYILQTAAQYSQDQDDPHHDFFTTTETASLGFLPVSLILKLYAATDGYTADGGLVAETAFTVAMMLPPERVAGAAFRLTSVAGHAITPRTVLKLEDSFNSMHELRRTIESTGTTGLKAGERIPVETTQILVDERLAPHIREAPFVPVVVTTGNLTRINRSLLNDAAKLIELFGEKIGFGATGNAYSRDGIVTKLVHPPGYASNYDIDEAITAMAIQKQILEVMDGTGALPRFRGTIVDENNILIGIRMDKASGKTLYETKGDPIKPSLNSLLQLMDDYSQIVERTGYLHGDIADIYGFSTKNITYNGNKFTLIDYGNGLRADNFLDAQNEARSLIRSLFVDGVGLTVDTSDESRIAGRYLLDKIEDEGKTLKQALEDYRLHPPSIGGRQLDPPSTILPPTGGPTRLRFGYDELVQRAISAGKAHSIPLEVVKPFADDVTRALHDFEAEVGQKLAEEVNFHKAIEEGRIFVIDDAYWDTGFPAQFRNSNAWCGSAHYCLVRRSIYDGEDERLRHTVTHELTHLIGNTSKVFPPYSAQTEEFRSIRTGIHEIMTDYQADLAKGVTPFSPQANNPVNRPEVVRGIFDRILSARPDLLPELRRYAYTGDDARLLEKVTGKPAGLEAEQEFNRWFAQEVKVNASAISVTAEETTGAVLAIAFGANIFLPDNQVTITNANQQGDQIVVSLVETQDGVTTSQLHEAFTLGAATQSDAGFHFIKSAFAFVGNVPNNISQLTDKLNCTETQPQTFICDIPDGLSTGSYSLVSYAYVTDNIEDTDSVTVNLSTGSGQITPPTPTPTSASNCIPIIGPLFGCNNNGGGVDNPPPPQPSPSPIPPDGGGETGGECSQDDPSGCPDQPQYCDEGETRQATGGYCGDNDRCVYNFEVVEGDPLSCGGDDGGGDNPAGTCSDDSDCEFGQRYCSGNQTIQRINGTCEENNQCSFADSPTTVVAGDPLHCNISGGTGGTLPTPTPRPTPTRTPVGTITTPADYVDLVVSSVVFSVPPGPTLGASRDVHVASTVNNLTSNKCVFNSGTGNFTTTFKLFANTAAGVSGNPLDVSSTSTNAPICQMVNGQIVGGESFGVSGGVIAPGDGRYVLQVCTDTNANIYETNEGNNCRQQVIDVVTSTPPPAQCRQANQSCSTTNGVSNCCGGLTCNGGTCRSGSVGQSIGTFPFTATAFCDGNTPRVRIDFSSTGVTAYTGYRLNYDSTNPTAPSSMLMAYAVFSDGSVVLQGGNVSVVEPIPTSATDGYISCQEVTVPVNQAVPEPEPSCISGRQYCRATGVCIIPGSYCPESEPTPTPDTSTTTVVQCNDVGMDLPATDKAHYPYTKGLVNGEWKYTFASYPNDPLQSNTRYFYVLRTPLLDSGSAVVTTPDCSGSGGTVTNTNQSTETIPSTDQANQLISQLESHEPVDTGDIQSGLVDVNGGNSTATPSPVPTATPSQCGGFTTYCEYTNSCQMFGLPCNPESQATPVPRQLLSITVDGTEIYPQNPDGIDLDLESQLAHLVVITYINERGEQTSYTKTLVFQVNIPTPTPMSTPEETLMPGETPQPTFSLGGAPVMPTPQPTSTQAPEIVSTPEPVPTQSSQSGVNTCNFSGIADNQVVSGNINLSAQATKDDGNTVNVWVVAGRFGDIQLGSSGGDSLNINLNTDLMFNDGENTLECRIMNSSNEVVYKKGIVLVHGNPTVSPTATPEPTCSLFMSWCPAINACKFIWDGTPCE